MPRTVKITDSRFGQPGPVIELPLPITASPYRLRTYIAALPGLAFALVALFALADLPGVVLSRPPREAALAAIALLIIIVLGVALALTFVTALRDLALPQPVIVIDEDGILDRRVLDRVIRWDEIAEIISYRKVNGGVLLKLKQPLATRFTLVRVGTMFHFWKPPVQAAYMAMNWLIGPYFPAAALFALAAKSKVPLFERRRIGGIVPMTGI